MLLVLRVGSLAKLQYSAIINANAEIVKDELTPKDVGITPPSAT
jgi:hypothetical protein